jgi:hypothetical protein
MYECVTLNLEIFMLALRVVSVALILITAPVLAHADD